VYFGNRNLSSGRQVTVRCTVRCQAGTASAKMASEWPLRPTTSHFRSPVCSSQCWRHTMLPWTTLRLGWGCVTSGEGPSSGLHGNSKSDAVLDALLKICVLSWQKKTFVLGRNWRQTAKLRSKSYCMVGPSLYGWDRTFQTDRTSTVLYDTNTVRTV